MRRLQALLLGPPEIRWDDQLFSIQRRYPRALLIYLASRGRMVSRHELLTLLWGEDPDATARLRLRETLGKLKGALPDPSLLISEHDLVGLDFNAVYVDLLEFLELTRQVQAETGLSPTTSRVSTAPLPHNIYQNLNKAVSLWRGPGFLSGASLPSTPSFDDWLVSKTQQVDHQRSWALEKLSEHASVMGDLEQALWYARAALENDELNEDLHEQVLRLLIQMGHRTKAREIFKLLLRPGTARAAYAAFTKDFSPGKFDRSKKQEHPDPELKRKDDLESQIQSGDSPGWTEGPA